MFCEARHAVTCVPTCQVSLQEVVCNYRVTLRRQTDSPTQSRYQDSRFTQKTKVIGFSIIWKKIMPQGRKEKKWWDFQVSRPWKWWWHERSFCEGYLVGLHQTRPQHENAFHLPFICITRCQKMKLLICRVSDKHLTVFISFFLSHLITIYFHLWDFFQSTFDSISIKSVYVWNHVGIWGEKS